MRFCLACLACLGLAACGDWPALSSAPSAADGADWPRLLPIGDVLGAPTGTISEEDGEALAARAAGLRARAEVLRRPVEDDAAFEAMRARLGEL